MLPLGVRTGLWIVAAVIVAAVIDYMRLRSPVAGERHVDEIVPRGYDVPFELGVIVSAAHDTSPHATPLPDKRPRTSALRQPTPPGVRLGVDENRGPRLVTTLRATVRGRHDLPAGAARVVGPLGMVSRDQDIAGVHHLIVYPDVITANRIAAQILRGRFTADSVRRRGALGLGTEFESIREYTPGDEIRRINWPATMRTGRPMTNQYRLDQDRDVLCVIDAGRLQQAPIGPLTRLDSAVDAATAVAYAADAVGDRVGALAFDREVLRRSVPRRAGGNAVVQAIYDLQPSQLESDYEQAFRVAGKMKRALVMLFTDLLEPSAARPLLEAMPVLTRRHNVVVATNRDDDLQQALLDGGRSVDHAYRAVSALDAIEAKDLVVAGLRHAGATVVEASADRLPHTCVASYLQAKSLARL